MNEEKKYFLEKNEELSNLKLENHKLELLINAKSKDLLLLDNQFMYEIATAINPETGKPLYSNDSKRDTELVIRQTGSLEWNALNDNISEMKSDFAIRNIRISEISNEIKYLLEHTSDCFEGQLRDFYTRVSDEITSSARQAAKLALWKYLSKISESFNNEID